MESSLRIAGSRDDVAPRCTPGLHVPGTEAGIEPHELSQRAGQRGACTIICADYSPDRAEITEVTNLADFLSHHRGDWVKVRWISVRGLADMEALRAIAEKYGLH